jgi:hypothetical protein
LQVLWALEPEVAPKEQVIDGFEAGTISTVLLLRVEDFSEMKTSQRHCRQAKNGCPREHTKEVGVDKATILVCLEKQCARLTTQLEAPPLWNLLTETRSVSSIICRALDASSKEEQAINRSST